MDASNTAKRPTILASIGRRLAARLIDCVIAVLIFFVVKFAAGALSAYVPAVTPKAGFLSAFFAAFAYFLLADALPNGQSLGKRLLSIATVDRKTRKGCSISQSFTRNSGALVVIGLGVDLHGIQDAPGRHVRQDHRDPDRQPDERARPGGYL